MTDKLTYPVPADVVHGTVSKRLAKLRIAIEHRIKENDLGSVLIHSLLQTSIIEQIDPTDFETGHFHADKKEIQRAHKLQILGNLYGPIVERLNEIRSGSLTIGDNENKCDFLLDEISDLIRELCPKE